MTILIKVKEDLKAALKEKNALKLSTLRLLWSEIHNREMQKLKELTDEEIVEVIQKEVKKRREAIELYGKGKREDLVKKEREEIDILNNYLPRQITKEELQKIVESVIKAVGAEGAGDFGRVMGAVMGKVRGQADGAKVSVLVKKLLS